MPQIEDLGADWAQTIIATLALIGSLIGAPIALWFSWESRRLAKIAIEKADVALDLEKERDNRKFLEKALQTIEDQKSINENVKSRIRAMREKIEISGGFALTKREIYSIKELADQQFYFAKNLHKNFGESAFKEGQLHILHEKLLIIYGSTYNANTNEGRNDITTEDALESLSILEWMADIIDVIATEYISHEIRRSEFARFYDSSNSR